MSTADARLWEMIEQIAREITDENGQFENKRLVDEIKDLLADLEPHVRAVAVEEQAKSLAASFVRRRTPKQRKTEAMFDAGAILPLGDGKRIWMEYATDTDLIEWARLSTKNLARVANAEGSRQGYVASRLEALRANPGCTLGRVEREVYGWTEEDIPAEYGDDFGSEED